MAYNYNSKDTTITPTKKLTNKHKDDQRPDQFRPE